MGEPVIRLATDEDLPTLQDIERAAGAQFRDLGMHAVADDAPPDVETLCVYRRDGRAWVFADDDDHPVAYLLVEAVDGRAHVEQVSVHPSHARNGIGRRLIEQADSWAAEHQLPGLTLTTYVNVLGTVRTTSGSDSDTCETTRSARSCRPFANGRQQAASTSGPAPR